MNVRMLSAVSVVSFMISAASAFTAEKPRWGKVICEPVAQNDAVAFATASPFLDNWDFMHVKDPPYVAPKGTLSCALPLQATSDTDSDGHTVYTVTVSFLDAPFHPAPCTVTYYDGTRARHFSAKGSGDGYVDLMPGSDDFGVNFFDDDQNRFRFDEFAANEIGRNPKIVWAGENQDDRAHVPVVSRCHVEL